MRRASPIALWKQGQVPPAGLAQALSRSAEPWISQAIHKRAPALSATENIPQRTEIIIFLCYPPAAIGSALRCVPCEAAFLPFSGGLPKPRSQASISIACVDFDLVIREILEYTRAGDSGNYRTFEFGEPVMLDSRKIGLLGLLLASYLLISPRVAHAQFPEGESKWTVLDVTAAINRAIDESKEGSELREKVVHRFSECSLMYGGLSTLASNAEAKKSYVQAQLATMEIESTIAKPLQTEKRLEIEEAARKSVAVMLRALNAQRDKDKEVGPLLKNCKAINDTKEIKNAVQALSLQ